MSSRPAARELSADDFALLQRIRAPLRAWLREAHGRRGLHDGVLGVGSAVVGLLALIHFDLSPLVALLHFLLALATAGFGARLAAPETGIESGRPFVSPLHALGFIEAVIATLGPRSFGAPAAKLPADCQPAAGPQEVETPSAAAPARRGTRLPPIRGFLLMFFGTMAVFMLPLAHAAAARFDRWDWLGLAVLLTLNAALLGSARRAARASLPDRPWDLDWALEAPTFGRLMFWKHYRLWPLCLAFLLLLLLMTMGMHARSDALDDADFLRTLEGRLHALAIVLFSGAGALNLLLLAAPWQARRKIAAIDAIEIDEALRQWPGRPAAQRN